MTKQPGGFKTRKRFGQHFLTDQQILQNIAYSMMRHTDGALVEIGPGQGALTDVLLPLTDNIHLVELDRDLVSQLKIKYLDDTRITISQADALNFDFAALSKELGQKLHVVGNLPYNISSPLIFHLFDQLDSISSMQFLLQKEVVERMCAAENTKDYSRLSVMTQYFCQSYCSMLVPPEAFSPPPKVDSAVVELTPHQSKPHQAEDFARFSSLVQQAFNYRRKTLHNSLRGLVSDEQLENLGIKPSARPQEVSVADWVRLSNNR